LLCFVCFVKLCQLVSKSDDLFKQNTLNFWKGRVTTDFKVLCCRSGLLFAVFGSPLGVPGGAPFLYVGLRERAKVCEGSVLCLRGVNPIGNSIGLIIVLLSPVHFQESLNLVKIISSDYKVWIGAEFVVGL